MDKEQRQMYRTFEIVTKYIANNTGVTLELIPNATPCCYPSKKHIILPSNPKIENIYPALAVAIHEAGHIKHTTYDLSAAIKDKVDKHLINATEDARIDRMLYQVLPNIRGFYSKLYKEVDKEDSSQLPFEVKILRALIRRYEGQPVTPGHDVLMAIYNGKLDHAFSMVTGAQDLLEHDDGPANRKLLRRRLNALRKGIFKAKQDKEQEEKEKEEQQQKSKPTQGDDSKKQKGDDESQKEKDSGDDEANDQDKEEQEDEQDGDEGSPSADDSGEDEAEEDGDDGSTQDDSGDGDEKEGDDGGSTGGGQGDDEGSGNDKESDGDGDSELDFSDLDREDEDKKKLLSADEGVEYAPAEEIERTCLREITKSKFSELLDTKETRTVSNGEKLDTGNLQAFPLGELEELFCEDKYQLRKKSKVIMVLDCSGSMHEPLYDGLQRHKCLIATAKSIHEILVEATQAYGIDVDYEIRAFGNEYHTLNKECWDREYLRLQDYGTDLYKAFRESFKEMQNSWEIDGNKLILLITDGEVYPGEITRVGQHILNSASDVKVMVVGVGADPTSNFLTDITRHNIISGEMADETLMGAISDMLN